MTDAKFKLEDILNKQKAPPQILDLVHIKIETEEDYKGVIEKIPDYKIKPERVSLIVFHLYKRKYFREIIPWKLGLKLRNTRVIRNML